MANKDELVEKCEEALVLEDENGHLDEALSPHCAGLHTFSQNPHKLLQDKAKEVAEAERDRNTMKWSQLFQLLTQLSNADKSYFKLSFLVPPQKGILVRKEMLVDTSSARTSTSSFRTRPKRLLRLNGTAIQ